MCYRGNESSFSYAFIGQLIGMRASSDFVRHGEKKAVIEGIFDIDESKDAIHILKNMDIDVDEDFLLVKRGNFSALVKVFVKLIIKQLLYKIYEKLCRIIRYSWPT